MKGTSFQLGEVKLAFVRNAEVSVDPRTIRGVKDAATIAMDVWDAATIELRESFAVMLLNSANQMMGFQIMFEGGLNAALVDVRGVFQLALLANAAAIILVHNHPSGNTEPSRADIALTRQLAEAGKVLEINVLDSLIITPNGEYTSLAERGIM